MKTIHLCAASIVLAFPAPSLPADEAITKPPFVFPLLREEKDDADKMHSRPDQPSIQEEGLGDSCDHDPLNA